MNNTNRNAFRLDRTVNPSSLANVQQACAIQLATGVFIDTDNPDLWPCGVTLAWNDAADAGAFDDTETVGDMAEAFLRFQLATLTNRRADK